MKAKAKEYALYKGEEILAIGTITEIAKNVGLSNSGVLYYKTPTYLNRLRRKNRLDGNVRILIELEDD